MTAPRLHTVAQVAEHLGCHERTVYRLVASGRLRTVHLGTGRGLLRVRDDDLAAFIDAATSGLTRRGRRSTAA